MSSHKFFYKDQNGTPRVKEFYGSDADASRWATSLEKESGQPVEAYTKDYYSGEVTKFNYWK